MNHISYYYSLWRGRMYKEDMKTKVFTFHDGIEITFETLDDYRRLLEKEQYDLYKTRPWYKKIFSL